MERSKPNCHIPDTVQTLSEADGGSNLVCSINVKSFHLFKRFCAVYFFKYNNNKFSYFHHFIKNNKARSLSNSDGIYFSALVDVHYNSCSSDKELSFTSWTSELDLNHLNVLQEMHYYLLLFFH